MVHQSSMQKKEFDIRCSCNCVFLHVVYFLVVDMVTILLQAYRISWPCYLLVTWVVPKTRKFFILMLGWTGITKCILNCYWHDYVFFFDDLGITKTWKFLMVTLGSTRIRTERDGWFLLLNVEVGEIVVTLWRNAKLWSGADPRFLVSERDVMEQCRVSEGLDRQGFLREYVVDVRCLIFLEGANLNSVLELCSIVIWVLLYYTDFLVGICVCAGCTMKSYSHGFISCNTIICSVFSSEYFFFILCTF